MEWRWTGTCPERTRFLWWTLVHVDHHRLCIPKSHFKVYEAVIESMDRNEDRCVVRFKGYGWFRIHFIMREHVCWSKN